MSYENVMLERDGQVAIITLNRPEKLNALNHRLIEELLDALDVVAGDDDVRAVVITGAGRAFCSGDDISGGAAPATPRRGESPSTTFGLRNRLHALIKAVIS